MKKAISVGKKIATLLLVATLGAGGYAIYEGTNHLKSGWSLFFIEHNDVVFQEDTDNHFVYINSTPRFDVGYHFGGIGFRDRSYTAKIVPVRQFLFSVDGNMYKWHTLGGGDFSAAFDLTTYDGYFTLTFDKTITQTIEYYMPSAQGRVEYLANSLPDEYQDQYRIIVTASDGKTSLEWSFHTATTASGIVIVPGNVEF